MPNCPFVGDTDDDDDDDDAENRHYGTSVHARKEVLNADECSARRSVMGDAITEREKQEER